MTDLFGNEMPFKCGDVVRARNDIKGPRIVIAADEGTVAAWDNGMVQVLLPGDARAFWYEDHNWESIND